MIAKELQENFCSRDRRTLIELLREQLHCGMQKATGQLTQTSFWLFASPPQYRTPVKTVLNDKGR